MRLRLNVLIPLSLMLCMASWFLPANAQTNFIGRTVAGGMVIPWEIEEAPDGWLWVSQRHGIIERVHPDSGLRDTVLDIRAVVYKTAEIGLLGFALHPGFPDTPIVVVAYVVKRDEHPVRIVSKFKYDGGVLVDEESIFTLDPAGTYHQGCRLRFAPDRTLLITMGDQPESWLVMDSSSTMGKLLRLNLDGSVPADNPFPGYAMWTRGHRNMQGLLYLPNGALIGSEHGNSIEDEVNIIHRGANYGWPYVEGPCDTDDEQRACEDYDVVEPFWSTGPETFAVSDMAFYDNERYPALHNSILVATLKHSALMQLTLDSALGRITEVNERFKYSFGRLRDVCVTRNGRVFVCTSNREPNGFFPFPRAEDDRLVELIPVADTCMGIALVPDTLNLGPAVVGDSVLHTAPITNTGCAPLTIDYMYMLTTADTASVVNLTWRRRMVVMPGDTYDLEIAYRPLYEGTHLETIQIGINGTNEPGPFFITFRGNTQAGLLKALSDSVSATTLVDGTSVLSSEFKNVGNMAVVIDSVTIDGLDANEFTTDFISPYTVQPLQTIIITVRHSAIDVGIRQARLVVHSTSYREPAVLLRSTVVTSHVDEGAAEAEGASGGHAYTVDLLGRVVDEANVAPGLYYRVRATRTRVVCNPMIVR